MYVDKEINTIQKSIRRRKEKDRKYSELSLRVNELKNLKTDFGNKIDALKQIISHIEEVKDVVKRKIKELKNKFKSIPKENPFDFTDFAKKQKEDDEVDFGLFLELAEENNIIYNQTPVNTLRRYGKTEKWLYEWVFFKKIDFSKIVMN